MALTDKLSAIADAIREKTGGTASMTLEQMVAEIGSISGGSEGFIWGGKNAVLVGEYSESWGLADTSFVIGSSANTSATSIKAAISNRYTTPTSPTYAFGDKDIIVVQKCTVTPTHGDGVTGKGQQIGYAFVHVTRFSKRGTTPTSAKTYRTYTTETMFVLDYYNTSGVASRGQTNHGFYMTPSAATLSSATSASAYIKISSPILYYRANSTYETTANIKTVTECEFKWDIEVYAVDKESSSCATFIDELDEMLTE